MIASIANLTRWEWFKLRKRWMPWILIAIAVFFSQMAIWGPFFSYQSEKNNPRGSISFGSTRADGTQSAPIEFDCNAIIEANRSQLPPDMDPSVLEGLREDCRRMVEQNNDSLESLHQVFTLPGSIATGLGVAQGFSLILVAIITASAIGSEFGWGTVRTILVKGAGRRAFLISKLLILVFGLLLLLLLVVAFTLVSSSITGALAESQSDGFWGPGFIADLISDIARTWFSLWPFVALATLVTVAARSTAAGMAAAIGYYFAELITSGIFMSLFEWFRNVSDYMLVRNITAWMQGMQLRDAQDVQVGIGVTFGEYPSDLHAFLVLVAYTLVMGILAFWLFWRRDVTSGAGG